MYILRPDQVRYTFASIHA